MKIASTRVETRVIQTRTWEESTHQVLVGKKIVGVVLLSKTQTSRNQVCAEFSSSKQTLTNFKKLLLPKRFTFIWVEIVKIQEHSRGRGYGSQIFNWMKATYRNTLIGLHPKEIAADYDINMILRFYKKQGFEISRFEYEWYGFLYLK